MPRLLVMHSYEVICLLREKFDGLPNAINALMKAMGAFNYHLILNILDGLILVYLFGCVPNSPFILYGIV